MGVLGYEPLESQLDDACAEGSAAARRRDVGVIAAIEPGGLGERAGLMPGDRIHAINGEPIRDAIDLLFHAAESELEIRYERPDPDCGTEAETKEKNWPQKGANGAKNNKLGAEPAAAASSAPSPAKSARLRSVLVERDSGEELGIVLEDFKIKMCNNQCVFCFIHQNPPGLRKGIYFKDGDYRMSFLHGNYITTTNMKDDDFERIIEQRLSPMYVSVHTTNPELRVKMLGVKRAPDVLERLKLLRSGEIEFHTQIVLCPGLNDGAELDRTLRELAKLRPELLSIAVVPLGMTEHREGLPALEPVSPSFCRRTIEQVEPWREKFKKKFGEPLVYLADEFYITADLPAPDYSGIDVLHQLENGVGMVWDFMRPWKSVRRRLPASLDRPRSVGVMTGLLGARVLREISARLNKIEGLRVDVIPCMNGLFGRTITVAGLLSGGDFLRAIAENPGHDAYLIPGSAVRAEGGRFLDDMTMDELAQKTRGRARAVDGGARELIEAVLGHPLAPAPKREAKGQKK